MTKTKNITKAILFGVGTYFAIKAKADANQKKGVYCIKNCLVFAGCVT